MTTNPDITQIATKLLVEYKSEPGHENSLIASYKIMHKDLNSIKSKQRKKKMMGCFNSIFHNFIKREMEIVKFVYKNAGNRLPELTYTYIIEIYG